MNCVKNRYCPSLSIVALALAPLSALAGVIAGPATFGMGGPEVDAGQLQAPAAGFSDARLKTATLSWAPCDPNSCRGAFRTACPYSHENFDDPLVYNGMKDESHLHVYSGNTSANYQTNFANIRTTGNSTCPGGTYNRSMYWSPVIIDTATGKPIHPETNEIYYKHGFDLAVGTQFFVPAVGLRMVAGSMSNTSPNGPFRFTCQPSNVPSQSIPNCPVGDKLWASIEFPQCWDGVSVDSADHRSHVVNWVLVNGQRVCPSTHPKPIPKISFNWIYPAVATANQMTTWRLSSDMSLSVPAGYSMHGDWVNGWDPTIMGRWITNCLNNAKDCHNDLLGDGTTLY